MHEYINALKKNHKEYMMWYENYLQNDGCNTNKLLDDKNERGYIASNMNIELFLNEGREPKSHIPEIYKENILDFIIFLAFFYKFLDKIF